MGHWYCAETGEARYTYTNSKGEEKDTTKREARKLNLVPSVTGIIDVIAKPGLEVWKEQQLLKAVLDWPPPDDFDQTELTPEEWIKQIKLIASAIGREAAERGRQIHDALEQWFSDPPVNTQDPFITTAVDCIYSELGTSSAFSWVPEASFARDGYGGKIDLHSKSGQGIIIDFKTKITSDKKKMKATDSNIMQLAAYRHGLDLPNARCYNLFISTEEAGVLHLQEITEEELQRGWQMFKSLLKYWQLVNKFGE